jgi:uncharacterized protein YjiS (DUF1127 family)
MVMNNYHVQTLTRPLGHVDLGNPAKRLWDAVVGFQQRYEQRRHLLELDDRLLDDMGFSFATARQEAARPFWKG